MTRADQTLYICQQASSMAAEVWGLIHWFGALPAGEADARQIPHLEFVNDFETPAQMNSCC